MQGLADSTRALLGAPRERTWAEQVEEDVCSVCPAMTYKQRVLGCAVCSVIGMVLEFGAFVRFLQAAGGNPAPFAIFYTLGNIIAICGSFFLSGPRKQCKSMCDKTRRFTVFIFFAAMFLTLFVAFSKWMPVRPLLIVVLVVIQSLALTWYLLSYIPFARQWVTTCCTSMCGAGSSAGGS